MAIREGRWDCCQCGTKAIRGRDMHCPGCGRKRPKGTQFYLADGEPVVADVKQIERAKLGPDWYCQWCNSSNTADRTDCTQCSAEKGSAPSAPVRDYKLDELPRDEDGEQPDSLPQTHLESNYGADAFQRTSPNPAWLAAGIAALVIGIVALLFWPRNVTLRATGFSWHREVQIQKYVAAVEEDWDVPTGGRELSRRREIRRYEKVLDHYETRTRPVSERVQTGTEPYVCGSRDLGNGYFEDVTCTRPVYETEYRTEEYREPIYRQDPVYDIKHRYEIDKWVSARTERSSGQRRNDPEPHWPTFTLVGNGGKKIGDEREAGRSEAYTVHFVSQDKEHEMYSKEVDRTAWNSYKLNGLYTARTNRLRQLSEIRELKAEAQ